LLRRRRLIPVLATSLALVAIQLWQVPPATAAGPALCAEVGVGDDSIAGLAVESPEVCPYVDRGIIDDVLPPDPGVWAALPPTAKSLFRVARVTQGPNAFEPDAGTSSLPAGFVGPEADCGGFTVTVKGENDLGEPLWIYGQRLRNCWNGRNVISAERARWGQALGPGWTFEGHIQEAKTGRVPAPSIRRYTKGRFSFGAVYVFLEYAEPWIDMTRTATGGRTWATGQ
jgi:hypothetical protein